jgi:putative ABC transport system ATP-binding protein
MLALENISKTFLVGEASEVRALDQVDLTIGDGDFVTVIGSNGAGKSTLLKAIVGLVQPETGRVVLDGRDITGEPVHRRAGLFGRIAQDPNDSTCAGMTIEENLAMAAKRGQRRGLKRAVTPALRENFRLALMETGLGLENRLETRMGLLSGGQRQTIALLMATLAGPRLLLLDEHLAALDPKTAELVMGLTDRLVRERRLTTLMITHNMADAIRWGSRLVMMHRGRIIFEATGEAKAGLTVGGLVRKFHEAGHSDLADDRLLLS